MFNWRRKKSSDAPADQDVFSQGVIRDVTGTSQESTGSRVRLDFSQQRLRLSIPDAERFSNSELSPTCGTVASGFVSASILALEAKLFDDGLYAAVDLAAQPAKAKLLAALADRAPVVAAAAGLGGQHIRHSVESERIATAFLADPHRSKPLGFYTSSDELRQIFQQDRLLQEKLDPTTCDVLTHALASNVDVCQAYDAHLGLVARLTNPFTEGTLRQGGCHFFPPSVSHEADLVKQLYANQPIPDGFSLANELVRRIRNRSIALEPKGTSGWYDYQTWALEPFAALERTPEGARLEVNERYREQLADVFTAVLALTRETHVKQLEVQRPGASMRGRPTERLLRVAPSLTVEPIKTYYERRALAYEFVWAVLDSAGLLSSMATPAFGRRSKQPFAEALAQIIAVFRDAASVAAFELGMAPASETAASNLHRWLNESGISGEDIRMMVPVFYDVGRNKMKVWAVLGWATRLLSVSFATPPAVVEIENGQRVEFTATHRPLAYPVFVEAYVSHLLDRKEFRAHCDKYKTTAAIVEHL